MWLELKWYPAHTPFSHTAPAQASKWIFIPKLIIEIPSKNRYQWTCFGFLEKIPPSVYHFECLFPVLLSTVTIVLPKGNQREAGRLGNGVAGRRPLGGGLAVFWSANKLACVFIIMTPVDSGYCWTFHEVKMHPETNSLEVGVWPGHIREPIMCWWETKLKT